MIEKSHYIWCDTISWGSFFCLKGITAPIRVQQGVYRLMKLGISQGTLLGALFLFLLCSCKKPYGIEKMGFQFLYGDWLGV